MRILSQLTSRVTAAGSQPISASSLAAFRIVFGTLSVVAIIRFVSMGWVSELYIEPAHHFTYYGFGWVQPWPGWGMYLHFGLMGLASLGVALGYRYRLSIVAFFLLFTYVELIDRTTYLNHYYFISLISFLMIFLPLNRTASLDAWRATPTEKRQTAPMAAIWILRSQIGLVYLFAGVAKLNPDWLLNAEPLANLALQQHGHSSIWNVSEGGLGALRHELDQRRLRPDYRRLAPLEKDPTFRICRTGHVPPDDGSIIPVHRDVPLDNDRCNAHLLRPRLAFAYPAAFQTSFKPIVGI